MTEWLTAQALCGMAVDQSTDDSLCMMLFHTKVFALYTEHVCESIAKSSRANTAYVEINSQWLKSLCPSQKANFIEGTWQAKHPFKCLFKKGRLLGMFPVSSSNAWGSGSENRGSWHFLEAKAFSFQGWAEESSGPCSDLPHTMAISNTWVLFFSWKNRLLLKTGFLPCLSPQLPFWSSAEIWVVVFVSGAIYSLWCQLTLPYSPGMSIRHK